MLTKRTLQSALLIGLVVFVDCTAYQAKGLTGGFSQTQLSEYVYEVRFQGNGYTSADRVGQFLLRRAAELTLETGHRYFVVGDQRGQSPTWGTTFRDNSATVRILSSKNEAPNAADAVIVIHSTDAEAGGRLSDAARQQLTKYVDQ